MSVTNHVEGATYRLGPWDFLYTPAGQSHSVTYHADTTFFLGFDGPGPLDIIWDDAGAQGVQWASEAARQAAEANPWSPPSHLQH